jgi:radical SAM superfamily enzyme YgiQ (UPF0313 family)
MKILLIYPEYPETVWSFKYAIKFISKKADSPPLGLLTVAAMLPEVWEKKLVDMNATRLQDKDIEWADLVFVSAMTIQKESAVDVIARCKRMSVKIVAGGPLFTTRHEEFSDVDHFVLNEAENTLPLFLDDLANGCTKNIYTDTGFPGLENTPCPLWELADMEKYYSMNIQYSRGCPNECEFCDIIHLFGHKFRTKNRDQVITELESLYSNGWRGRVFFIDDNFAGNRRKLKSEILPAITEWMASKKYPFSFITQITIDIADDEELMRLMVNSGFNTVFVGIETPHKESLLECNKIQNLQPDLLASVHKIQNYGLNIIGGFIVGFDSDPVSIFEKQIEFIRESGIVAVMVGLLNAPHGSRLYRRLLSENRILKEATGDNTGSFINFIPKMSLEILVDGYKKIIREIYSPKPFYDRVRKFYESYRPLPKSKLQKVYIRSYFVYLVVFLKSAWILGVIDKSRVYYWKLVLWTIFRRFQSLPITLAFAIQGFHFRKVFKDYL